MFIIIIVILFLVIASLPFGFKYLYHKFSVFKRFSNLFVICESFYNLWSYVIFDTVTLFFPILILLIFIGLGIISLNEELILAFIFLGFFYDNFFIKL